MHRGIVYPKYCFPLWKQGVEKQHTGDYINSREVESRFMARYTLYDKVCQWSVVGRWFSPGTSVSSTNKTHQHAEILLKVALSTMTLILIQITYLNLWMIVFPTYILTLMRKPLQYVRRIKFNWIIVPNTFFTYTFCISRFMYCCYPGLSRFSVTMPLHWKL